LIKRQARRNLEETLVAALSSLLVFQEACGVKFLPEFGPVDWFESKHARSESACLFEFFRNRDRGDDYDWDGAGVFGRQLTKPTKEFEAAKAWQVNV
jgi:hypothetical protein